MQAADDRQPLKQQLQRAPEDFIAWLMLADSEMSHGDIQAGMIAAQTGLSLRPGHPEALARVGRACWMQGQHAQAIQSLRQAHAQLPQHPGIALWLAHALEDGGEAEAAADAYQLAHQLLPDEVMFTSHLLNWRRRLCDWTDVETLSQQLRQAISQGRPGVEPFAFLSEDASPLEQLACARLRARELANIPALPPAAARPMDAPLRVGFLSNGFGAHPTGLLTVALFEALAARAEIELHLFALNPDDGSAFRCRLRAAAQGFHNLSRGMSHAAMAAHIRSQDIDVLFDLRGWGGGGVPEVLAMRPAPVQVNWLAYPGTSGAPWMDYLLADRIVVPAESTMEFSEKVVWLPRCFQPSDTRRTLAQTVDRLSCGLPPNAVVFACFNNSYKINPRGFGRMLEILRQVPDSVLWLLAGPGQADQRLRAYAQQAGVDPNRLVFMQKMKHDDYMARYPHADLFLDTHPYNAHTTASDALWAGCPVLTCPGSTFASRVAASLNHHLGMDALIAKDDDDFIQRAVSVGQDAKLRQQLRERVAERRTTASLFDMDGFSADFSATVRAMAMHQRRGGTPATFAMP